MAPRLLLVVFRKLPVPGPSSPKRPISRQKNAGVSGELTALIVAGQICNQVETIQHDFISAPPTPPKCKCK